MKEKENEYVLYFTAVIVVLLIIGAWYFTYYKLVSCTPTERGTFGDMFGSVNALFSGLALAGIIFTILLQRKELKYQRDELRETRKEFIIQNKSLKNQRFENTFFNLLTLHNQLVNDIDYFDEVFNGPTTENLIVKGRDVFKDRYTELKEKFLESNRYDVSKDEIEKIYLKFYNKYRTDFGHYYRNLYRIFKMVNEVVFFTMEELELNEKNPDDIELHKRKNWKEKYKYASIIRAQLSDYELLLLFYNCLSKNGEEKFKPLIEEYSILKNIDKYEIIHTNLIQEYLDSAYKINF